MFDLSIIIVNYKTPDLTSLCLESIIHRSYDFTYEIIIVDNDSQDHSEFNITQKFPEVKWINSSENVGFGRANNLGIESSVGKYILILNSDTIFHDDSLKNGISLLEKNKRIGVLGCTIYNEDLSIQNFTSTVANYNKILDRNLFFNYIFKTRKYKLECVMGSFMLIPKSVFNEVGMFDPDFFMYSEEVELCYRINKKYKYTIEISPEINIIHKNGGSTSDRSWANKQSYLSSALLFFKIRGHFGYLLYHCLILINVFTNFFAMWLLNKAYRKDYWKDLSYYFYSCKQYILLPLKYKRKIGSGKNLLQIIQ